MRKLTELFVLMIAGFLVQTSVSLQNQAPMFQPLQSNYFIKEYNLTKPGDILFWLNATDLDDDDLEFGVENGIYRKLLTVKKIDNKHAIVIANQIFDREVQEKYENIVFYVRDKPGNKVVQSVRFVIVDIDDNAPVFKRTPYRISISENTPPGTLVFDSIEAVDIDGPLYNKFEFRLSERDEQAGLFAVDKTQFRSSGHYSTSLVLKERLNYEVSKTHVITLVAVSKTSSGEIRSTSTTELVVTVLDAPDRPPEFIQSPYYVKLEEELPIGEFVVQVQAKDGDSGINNPCRYEIIDDGSPAVNYFAIDARTGVIEIKDRIDLESSEIGGKLGGLLEFSVRASELGDENSTHTTRVIVSVSDINDNEPKFNKDQFWLNLLPSQTNAGSTLALIETDVDSIRVYDPDKGVNGSMSLYLFRVLNNDSYGDTVDFEVIPKLVLNDGNLIVKVKSDFNVTNKIGSEQHYHLIAKDNGINGKAVRTDLFVRIQYTNQYAPQFINKSYLLRVDENAEYNTTVGFLNAFDNDTYEDFGEVSYELKNGQNRFQIDKETGRIYTVSNSPEIELDRESIDTYYMNVEATDGGGLRTSVQLVIKLNDVNDNRPQFISNLYSSSSSAFPPLSMSSTISLTDSFSSSSEVDQSQYHTLIGFIEENTDKWFEPIRLQAFDRDLGLNGMIEFEIDASSSDSQFADYFRVNEITKCVDLKPNVTLDFEEIVRHRRFNSTSTTTTNQLVSPGEVDIDLVIVARDLGIPSLSSKINARVIVKDVNDNKPIFEKIFYSAEVYETAKMGDVIQVKAVDFDASATANSKIIYSIVSGNKDKFFIDSSSGMVKINENSNLDRDLFGSFYTLKIAANDFGSINSIATTVVQQQQQQKAVNSNSTTFIMTTTTNSSENFCFLTIKVLDVNNKKPKFATYPEIVNIPEDAQPNSKIIRLEAIDSDLNANLFYFLIKDNSSSAIRAFDENNNQVNSDLLNDWFGIDAKTGDLYTKSQIDRELAEYVFVVVGVEDLNASQEFKPQITTTIVKIHILDVNDNYPLFPNYKLINVNYSSIECEEPIFETFEKVEENTKINTRLTQLRAIDSDKHKNLTYKIVHSTEPGKSLAVEKFTGNIYVNGPIDYETTKWINLTILVSDNGGVGANFKSASGGKHSLLNYYCQVLDVNDNAPKFVQPNTTEFRLFENNEPGAIIAQFKATDSDSNENGRVIYTLLNGGNDKFEIDPINGTLRAKSVFDREEQNLYTLVIQAIDSPATTSSLGGEGGEESTSRHHQLTDSLVVKVRILDQNDNRPECEQDTYSIEVSQNADIGTILTQVKGIDYDLGRNAQLRYFIHALTIHHNNSDMLTLNEMVTIDPVNGQIRTKKKLNEFSGLYRFTITLMDNGPAAPSKANLRNDSEQLGGGEQSNLSGTCLLEIFIRDYNMHAPKFIFPNANNSIIRIKSSLQIGSRILTVEAFDEDRGENGRVRYRIDRSRPKHDDWKNFNLDESTGVLTLNTRLNPIQQSSFTVDLIAYDRGKPTPLSSRFTLVLVVVDESNNAAHFNRMQICLVSGLECEKDYQSMIVRFREEEVNYVNHSVALNFAKMGDLSKNSSDICYYLMGIDRQYFKIGKKSGLLMPRARLDREKRERYEVIVKSSEYCLCSEDQIESGSSCSLLLKTNNTFDANDISQLRIKILVQDVNDNVPKFAKKFYQVGLTSDVEFGEVVLDSYVSDLDSTGSLNISIDKASLRSNADSRLPHGGGDFPFMLNVFDESRSIGSNNLSSSSSRSSKSYRFQLKTNVYLKPAKPWMTTTTTTNKQLLNSSKNFTMNTNVLYQFNLNAWDENAEKNRDSTVVQIILINKQQRVKLVFSQPIERVLKFQDEFQTYISNLTGYKAYIDKIYLHKTDDDFEYSTTTTKTASKSRKSTHKPIYLTDMLLHFTQNDKSKAQNDNYIVINADTILNILDRSVDLDLLKKYKLTVAEKYDDQGSSTFYKYGSLTQGGGVADDDDYANFFDLGVGDEEDLSASSSVSSSSSSSSSSTAGLLTRLVLLIACCMLSFLLTATVVVFYCMKKTYKRKLRAERAMVKAFGLEQSCSMMTGHTYHDGTVTRCGGATSGPLSTAAATLGGYLNMAFDSNSLLPIPGTNLYAYEGSNPMWLKKYEKVDSKNNTSTSVTSSSLPSSSSGSDNNSRRGSSASSRGRENEKNEEKKKENSNITAKKQPKSSSPNKINEDITSFYLKQIDSNSQSTSPLKLFESNKDLIISKQQQSVIGELNFLSSQQRGPSLHNNNNNDDEDDLVPATPPNHHLSSYQRETLLTFATDDTLINNAITAAIANSNQTMKSFKRPSEILESFRDDLKKKTTTVNSSKKSAGFTNLVDLDPHYHHQSPPQPTTTTTTIKHSNLAQNVFQRTTNFTKIFDTCTNGSNSGATTLLAAKSLNQQQQHKDDSFLLINQPVVSKDVCDLFAVESTVI